MKNQVVTVCAGLALVCMSTVGSAANSFRTALIEDIQLDSHVRVGYEDVV
jgi:hypothetical protein